MENTLVADQHRVRIDGSEELWYSTAMKSICTIRIMPILAWMSHRNHLIIAGTPAA
jgi:hypothetical protein